MIDLDTDDNIESKPAALGVWSRKGDRAELCNRWSLVTVLNGDDTVVRACGYAMDFCADEDDLRQPYSPCSATQRLRLKAHRGARRFAVGAR